MYPRDYFQQSGPVEIGTCFVAMPFSSSFDPTFDAIKTAICNDLAFRAIRTDELLGGGNIIADILRGLATSEIVIADLTDRNPNVYYELGLAHMCKPVEKVVLLSQEIDAIPFDLRAFRHIEYQQSETGRATLIRELRQAVSSICAPVYRLPIVDSAA